MAVYVGRNGGGIYGIWTVPQAGVVTEELEEDHPDVIAFRNRPMAPPGGKTMEQRLAALETDVSDLKRKP